jgi:hypothetical protein
MRRVITGLAVVLAAVVFAPPAAAAPSVSFTMSGTAGTNGWYRSNVTIHWVVSEPQNVISSSGCEPAQLVTTEGTTSHTCTVTFVGGSSSGTATPKIDRTVPTVTGASAARSPDSNGWYNHPVTYTFAGSDATSGIASCSSPTYGGGDGASVGVSGACTDNAGNTSVASLVTLQYDATPPAVAAATDRPPTGAWYRKPVTVSFGGTDATSGLGACSAPVRYAGPDGEAATVKGSCTDNAGNGAEASHTFKYDATAPKLGKPRVERGQGSIRISWQRGPDFASTQLVRTPGVKGSKPSVVYSGKGSSFVDRSVRDGRRYRYQLVVGDAAGNLSGRVVTATPRPPLYRPGPGQRVRAPLTLAWEAVAGARFYNVQLHRNGVKVLSAWPRQATLRVRPSWRYAGRAQRLEPGRYVWYVWPAHGTLARPVFGRPLGSSSFVVARRA